MIGLVQNRTNTCGDLDTWSRLVEDITRHQVTQHTLSNILISSRLCCQVGVADITRDGHK